MASCKKANIKARENLGDDKVESVGKAIERPANWLIAAACVVTVVMMFHIVGDVFAKYIFNSPIEGTIEIVAGYYMVAVVFLPFAYVTYTEGQIIVELFTRGLSKRNLIRFDGLIAIATLVYMTIFTWNTVDEAIYQTGQREIWETGTFEVAIWPSRWIIPIGCGVMAVFVLYRLVRDLRGDVDE